MIEKVKGIRRKLNIGLFWRILPLILLVGLVPLILLAYFSIRSANVSNDNATNLATAALDEKSLESLKMQAIPIANSIEFFLSRTVQDTLDLSSLPREPEVYIKFQQSQNREISWGIGSYDRPQTKEAVLPFYREVTFINRVGQEVVRVKEGRVLPPDQLRDVSNPANTTYKTEDYFAKTRVLPRGEVYVSRVMAWHTSTPLQPGGGRLPDNEIASNNLEKYEAVLRFATPVFGDNNTFEGIVMVSLDMRHLYEYFMHVVPLVAGKTVPWPQHKTGNYMYAWDDQGYLIVHPLLWQQRGVDQNGNLLKDWSSGRPPVQERETALFRMQIANAPVPEMYRRTLANEPVGNLENVSQDGARKANIYVPIRFNLGEYKQSGIFGGLAISANVADFHSAASEIKKQLDVERDRLSNQTILIITASLGLLIVAGGFVAFSITRPVARLTKAARNLEKGESDYGVLDGILTRRTRDEVTNLAEVFKQMSDKVFQRESELKYTNQQLEDVNSNLEDIVLKRTDALANANQEIMGLNERLKAENVRLSAEIEITRQIQEMILPKEQELKQIEDLEISSFMLPAEEVGGDYYDVLQDNGRVMIGIGDVTGHGLESGVVMIMVQTAVRTLLANNEENPSRYLGAVNKAIYENVKRMSTDKNLTLSLLDYDKGNLRLSGQHEETIICRANGSLELIDTIGLGFPIGLEEDISAFVNETNLRLYPGDVLVLYTDGIPEAENTDGLQYGLPRFCEVIKANHALPAADLKKAVIEDLMNFIGTQKVFDDITLLILKQKEFALTN
jgi:serine phosphatase RsbU (regulator of sigma subunit)